MPHIPSDSNTFGIPEVSHSLISRQPGCISSLPYADTIDTNAYSSIDYSEHVPTNDPIASVTEFSVNRNGRAQIASNNKIVHKPQQIQQAFINRAKTIAEVLLVITDLLLTNYSTSTSNSTSRDATPPYSPNPSNAHRIALNRESFLLRVPASIHSPSPIIFAFRNQKSGTRRRVLLANFRRISRRNQFVIITPRTHGNH